MIHIASNIWAIIFRAQYVTWQFPHCINMRWWLPKYWQFHNSVLGVAAPLDVSREKFVEIFFHCIHSIKWFSTVTTLPAERMHCRSHDVTQARTHVFPQCCYGAGSCTLCIYIRAFSIAITQGLCHNANVCEPIRECDSDFNPLKTNWFCYNTHFP